MAASVKTASISQGRGRSPAIIRLDDPNVPLAASDWLLRLPRGCSSATPVSFVYLMTPRNWLLQLSPPLLLFLATPPLRHYPPPTAEAASPPPRRPVSPPIRHRSPTDPPEASMSVTTTASDNHKALTRRRLPSSVEPPTRRRTTRPATALHHRVMPRSRRRLQSEIQTDFLLKTSTDSDS
jgi:hypothetical protein